MNVIVLLLALAKAKGGLDWEVIIPPNLLHNDPINLGRSARSLLGVFREAITEDWELVVLTELNTQPVKNRWMMG